MKRSTSSIAWGLPFRYRPWLGPVLLLAAAIFLIAAGSLPADLVSVCAERHRLASVYLHDDTRSVHDPCPNHMFGPPSYVQGTVEDYLKEWVLLLELSSRRPIGHEFGEGVLQFLILPSDLREGRFDRVKLLASAY